MSIDYKLLHSRDLQTAHVPPNSTVDDFLSIVRAAQADRYHYGCDELWSNGTKISSSDGSSIPLSDWVSHSAFVVAEFGRDLSPQVWQHLYGIDLSSSQSKTLSDSLRKSAVFNRKPHEFILYTTVSRASLLAGAVIPVSPTSDFAQMHDSISHLLRGQIGGSFELQIYLPGGLRFTEGTVQEWMNATPFSDRRIYAVVTRRLNGAENRPIDEICKFSDHRGLLLSPQVDSTRLGYGQIACLLGYFAHNGIESERLIQALAQITRFAPLLVSLNRLVTHLPITGADVTAITATLHCLFSSFVTGGIPPDAVFEHTFDFMAMLLTLTDLPVLQFYVSGPKATMDQVHDRIEMYSAAHGVQLPVVLWEADIGGATFQGLDVDEQAITDILDIAARVPHFKPLSPAALRYICTTAIMTGPRLFLGHASARGDVRYIDPASGEIREVQLDMLAADADSVACKLEDARFNQIIDVCIDESISMRYRLDGRTARKGDIPRFRFAKSYIGGLLSAVDRRRVSTVFGLLGFSDKVSSRAPLSPILHGFDQAVDRIEPDAPGTLLWDAISTAADRIQQFVADGYPHALRRIIVITDGVHEGPGRDLLDLSNRLITDHIVVDAVVVGTDTLELSALAAVCTASGGILVRPTPQFAAAVFEAEAFADLNSRVRGKPEPIDEGKFTALRANPVIAADATAFVNAAQTDARTLEPLVSPAVYVNFDAQRSFRDTRAIRICMELKTATQELENDIRVFPADRTVERWRLFISGPPNTPYQGLWWTLLLVFPVQYPMLPPVLRFVSIPYHPNVAIEGRVFFSKVEVGYDGSTKVADILVGVRQLLQEPEIVGAIRQDVAKQYSEQRAEFERQASNGSLSSGLPAEADWQNFPWSRYDE